jgi:hypothetical protein
VVAALAVALGVGGLLAMARVLGRQPADPKQP